MRIVEIVECIEIGECIQIGFRFKEGTPLFQYTPISQQFLLLWSDPAGAQLRAKALRRRAPQALLREMTYEDKASYDSTPPCRAPPVGCPKKEKFHKHSAVLGNAYLQSVYLVPATRACCLCSFFLSPFFRNLYRTKEVKDKQMGRITGCLLVHHVLAAIRHLAQSPPPPQPSAGSQGALC